MDVASTKRMATENLPTNLKIDGERFTTELNLKRKWDDGKGAEGGMRTSGLFKNPDERYPLITIITVVLNGKSLLEDTIQSVLSQDYPNVEYIVIDGGSSDGTLDIISKYDDFIDYWVTEEDEGIYDAMNKGLRCSTGELIGILNSGDYLVTSALSDVAKSALKDPQIDFFFGSVEHNGIRSRYWPWMIHWTFRFYTSHSAGFFIRRKAQKRIGLYSLRYPCSADYDLFYRLIVGARMQGKLIQSEDVLGVFRPDGFSSRFSYMEHLREQTQIRLDNGQNKIIVYLVYALRLVKNAKALFLRRRR